MREICYNGAVSFRSVAILQTNDAFAYKTAKIYPEFNCNASEIYIIKIPI